MYISHDITVIIFSKKLCFTISFWYFDNVSFGSNEYTFFAPTFAAIKEFNPIPLLMSNTVLLKKRSLLISIAALNDNVIILSFILFDISDG